MSSQKPSTRRNTLLFAAAVFLLIAGFLDPRLMFHFACHAGIMSMAFLTISAFAAAQGIRLLAQKLLRNRIGFWHTRSGVVISLCVALPCMNILFMGVDAWFVDFRAMGQVTSQQVRIFVFMALELMWLAMLE
jgi:hypothetical protein